MTTVRGYCPWGCGQTLFVGAGGFITCSWAECPHPDGVSLILEQDAAEIEHIVEFRPDAWTLRHPLRERLNDELLRCDVATIIANLSPHPPHGRYVIQQTDDDVWTFRPKASVI